MYSDRWHVEQAAAVRSGSRRLPGHRVKPLVAHRAVNVPAHVLPWLPAAAGGRQAVSGRRAGAAETGTPRTGGSSSAGGPAGGRFALTSPGQKCACWSRSSAPGWHKRSLRGPHDRRGCRQAGRQVAPAPHCRRAPGKKLFDPAGRRRPSTYPPSPFSLSFTHSCPHTDCPAGPSVWWHRRPSCRQQRGGSVGAAAAASAAAAQARPR